MGLREAVVGCGQFFNFDFLPMGGHQPAKFCPGPTIRFKVIDERMSSKPFSAKEKEKKREKR